MKKRGRKKIIMELRERLDSCAIWEQPELKKRVELWRKTWIDPLLDELEEKEK